MISTASNLLLALSLVSPIVSSQFVMREPRSTQTSSVPFTSDFHQPQPPLIQAEFKANWNQHKWNSNVSHIASGYLYSSPSQQKVRVDEAYDSVFGSSLFDFANVNDQGVWNVQWLLSPAISSSAAIWSDYVSLPAFPLVPRDILRANNAVFAGTTDDPYVGEVTKWNIMYAGVLPTTILVDDKNLIHGWDFWDNNERTYAITRLFNIVTGRIPKQVFDFPDPGRS